MFSSFSMNSPAESSEVNARKKRRARSKACIPCQKQKVRCLSAGDKQPCQRCDKRGIPCVFRRLPQYWKPNNDEALQINMAEDLRNLHVAINNILANKPQAPLGPLRTRLIAPESFDSPSPAPSPAPLSPVTYGPNDTLLDVSIKESDSVEPFNQIPIKSLYEITRLKPLRSRQLSPVSLHDETSPRMQQPLRDLVSEGRLDLEDAERLTQIFLNQTDHFLYSIAIFALHEPQGEALFDICSSELRRLISEFVFAIQVSIEDFQGLCIASF
ncbi:hypothetical protein BHE90_006066 [Fusarium euwallaceae]|uniref:Zn(2)-C6 fungal-type domain-containing protein n=4 Tax=Fusarium solani species complex TaxID=232080 RepID=A0A3M2SP42_9HYPO|nr:hypothetical protein CDV36_000974 [Fusarium kuroshium]RSM04318.1 hypothetical protein CEP52_006910 [Fusarium oligoseptatum]RTE79433.1 hypothetical protein BHE90_006066 [Fusarium euwallaceae]